MKYWNAFKGIFCKKEVLPPKELTDKWILKVTEDSWNFEAFYESLVWKIWLTRLVHFSHPKKDNLEKIIATLVNSKLTRSLKHHDVKPNEELLLEMSLEDDKAVFFLDGVATFTLKFNYEHYFRSLEKSKEPQLRTNEEFG